jgi:ADP-ribosylation factor protein 1
LDIGGRDKIRPLWRFLFEDVEALIFVIDSNDRCRFAEVKWELEKLLETEQLGNAKVLFLLNKQDLPNAAPVSEMVDFFKLTEMRHEWLVQPCCATTGEGLHEGIDALLELLNK